MQASVTQIDYDILLAWTLLTLATLILLSVLYRAVVKSMPKKMAVEPKPPKESTPTKFIFLSADVDEARAVLKSAIEDIEDGNFKAAVEKSCRAIADVLSQLLRYFSIDGKNMSIDNMAQALQEKGVKLHIHGRFDRLNEIAEKAKTGGELTREEAAWATHMAHFVTEMSKEARVEEGVV